MTDRQVNALTRAIITEPNPGFWLRVTPAGKSAPVVASPRFVGETDPSNMFYWSHLTFGAVKDDPEGTYYLPISLELLEIPERMAEVILAGNASGEELEELAENYQAAVAKAVGE